LTISSHIVDVETCRDIGVDRYPSLYFIGYGKLYQDTTQYPNIVKYTADIYPEALYDWITMLHYISSTQHSWNIFKNFLHRNSNKQIDISPLQQQVTELNKKVSLFSTELQKYKNRELFDNLPLNGDPFALLSNLTALNDVL
jgi:hypothetical protein